jgi:hypothetical protein
MHYDFDGFLNLVKFLDKEDILATAYKKHKSLDKFSSMYTTKDRVEFQENISGLLYWLEKNEKPPGLTGREFQKLKPLCENLIRKNQMEKESLDLFDAED